MTEPSRPEEPPADAARTWETPVLTAALALGLVLTAIQLWILTVALDLFLGGGDAPLWRLAAVSGGVFAGGLLVLRLLRARPGAR